MTPLAAMPESLSQAECARLIEMAEAAQMKDAGLVGQTTAHQIRRAGIAWLDDLPQGGWAMDRMIALVARANRENFGFDLSDFGESAQIARYRAEEGGHFDWHSDIGAGAQAARRKLTVVVQLSDPAGYRGGQLQLWANNAPLDAPPAQGTATVFPSFVLHRVTPLTAGVRWSLTLWAHGPAFR